MQEARGREQWASLECVVLKGDAHVLTVKRKAESTLIHIKEDSECSLVLEVLAVFLTLHIGVVPQVTNAEEGPTGF